MLYLTAPNAEKSEQMRAQGAISGLWGLARVGAHVGSGVLRAETLPLSLAVILPALAGQWLGGRVLDRVDQALFRKATLVVLFVVGLNPIRRALTG